MTVGINIASQHLVGAAVYKDEEFVRIQGYDFFGTFRESPNGVFLVAWQDSDRKEGVGGFRTKGHGEFVLAKDGKVLLTGKAERPNGGCVGDDGTFIIIDWLFGSGLGSKLLAFRKDGTQILHQKFPLNALNIGLSGDGLIACVQLCAGDHPDSGCLIVVDLGSNSILGKFISQTGSADYYEINSDDRILQACHTGGRKYRYLFGGFCLDILKYELDRIELVRGHERVSRIQDCLKRSVAIDPRLLLEKVEEVLSDESIEEKIVLAAAHRAKGELSELIGNPKDALRSYSETMRLNEKGGVGKRITALEKRIDIARPKEKVEGLRKTVKDSTTLSPQFQQILWDFSQNAFPGGAIKDTVKLPIDSISRLQKVLTDLEVLSLRDLALLGQEEQRIIFEMLVQYIMFLQLNNELVFPPGFLDDSSSSRLGSGVLSYIRHYRWPFPQMLG